MTEMDYSNIEIVGFNGQLLVPAVQCGRSLPVGHIKNNHAYFLANENFHLKGVGHGTVSTYSKRELDEYARFYRITLIDDFYPMVKDAMVIYATRDKLESNGFNPLEITDINESKLVWQNLPEKGVWVTVSNKDTIDKLFDKLKS